MNSLSTITLEGCRYRRKLIEFDAIDDLPLEFQPLVSVLDAADIVDGYLYLEGVGEKLQRADGTGYQYSVEVIRDAAT